MKLQSTRYNPFLTAMALVLILIIITAVFLGIHGKIDAFLILNHAHAPWADTLFYYATWLGDGMMWVPLGLYCLLFKRTWILPVILAIILSTFFIHFLKRVIYPDELRPISLVAAHYQLHFVEGVEVHTRNSFPSGHTGQAFTMALLLVYLIDKRWAAWVLPLLAALAGYSRIYLGQHFVGDVLAGMVIGLISAFLTVEITALSPGQKKIFGRWRNKN
jgi:membrane-associated phospholipid phosphatase